MPARTKLQIAFTLALTVAATFFAARAGSVTWLPFWLLLISVLLSSGFKVVLPRGDGSMSLNYPFILLGIIQLSPLQAVLLAGISVAAQSRLRLPRLFTAVQIAFNVANAMLATYCAYQTYVGFHHAGMTTAPSVALASLAYFLWNTVSLAMVLASTNGNGDKALKIWKEEFPWYLPFYLVGAVLAAAANWLSLSYGWGTAILLIPVVYTLYRSYMAQVSRLHERQRHLEETEALHLRTIEGLAMAIEAKDQNTHDHLFRVRHYVQAVGQELHLSKVEMQALETAAFLHDIGKLAVPEHIINKPGKLTPEEFEKMKIHPVVGADILERVRFPYPVVPIVRSHHEWWNGTGYPDGLQGNDIPIGARILTVVDCFDALVSDRPYRKGLSGSKALEMIRSLRGKQFDPVVVEAFERCYAEVETPEPDEVPAVFTPLNTDVEVWRGIAPGAGYEEGSQKGEPQAGQAFALQANAADTQSKNESLTLIAAASQEAQTLFELSQSLGNSLSPDETISVMASRLRKLIPFDVCALYYKQGSVLELRYMDGEQSARFGTEPLKLGEGLSGWVAQSGKPILNGNAAAEPGCPLLPNGRPALHSGLSVPLFDLQKEVFAVLTLYSGAVDFFSRDHLRILLAMESKLSLSLQNALQFNRTESDAETDFLTGLPNARRLFLQLEDELGRCTTTDMPLAVIVCDLNEFKHVNDRRGHLAGNRLLRTIAEGFRTLCSGPEMVARMGGDEFVFLLPGTTEATAKERLDAIRDTMESASRRAGHGVHVSASVGAAFCPADGVVAEDLLAMADRRMYLDKQHHYDTAIAFVEPKVATAVALKS